LFIVASFGTSGIDYSITEVVWRDVFISERFGGAKPLRYKSSPSPSKERGIKGERLF